MSEKLVCPVCGKEYTSPYHFDKHVESHGEHKVTWDDGEAVIEEIESEEIAIEPIEGEPALRITGGLVVELEAEPEKAEPVREATPRES